MSKILTTHNAQITTAAVEVKTLTISGKQVTLSVFRQLLPEDLISAEGTFTGVPWGRVNYHPWKCENSMEHLHIVWQKGDELRRDGIVVPTTTGPITLLDELGEEWLEAAALDGWRPIGGRSRELRIEFPIGTITVWPDDTVRDALWPPYGATQEEALAKLKEQAKRSRDELRDLVVEAIRAEVDRRQRHKARWDELNALPHLFIAV